VNLSNAAPPTGAALGEAIADALLSAGVRDPSLPAEQAVSIAAAPAAMRNHLVRADPGDMQVLR
jgi:hypothetical protein